LEVCSRSFEVERRCRGQCGWNDDGTCYFGSEDSGGEENQEIRVAEVLYWGHPVYWLCSVVSGDLVSA